MQFVGRVITSVSDFYWDINPSTLSGAIDILVIQAPSGELSCSPFHVRFGKLQLLRPQERIVQIHINGKLQEGIQMKVGEAGETFFVLPTTRRPDQAVMTSPLVRPLMGDAEKVEAITLETKELTLTPELRKEEEMRERVQSPTRWTWMWGGLPQKSKPNSELDPVASPISSSVLVEKAPSLQKMEEESMDFIELICSEQRVSSSLSLLQAALDQARTYRLLRLPKALIAPKNASISTLKQLLEESNEITKLEPSALLEEGDQSRLVLLVLISAPFSVPDESHKEEQAVLLPGALGLFLLKFIALFPEAPLPSMEALMKRFPGVVIVPKKSKNNVASKRQSRWRWWRKSEDDELFQSGSQRTESPIEHVTQLIGPKLIEEQKVALQEEPTEEHNGLTQEPIVPEIQVETGEPESSEPSGPDPATNGVLEQSEPKDDSPKDEEALRTFAEYASSLPPLPPSPLKAASSSSPSSGSEEDDDEGRLYYYKSLRLPHDLLSSLSLQEGMNTITFTVTTRLQGSAVCQARIFLWPSNARIVVSDIDGTITKSDALGHLMTMVGRDWTHVGVAPLYTRIARNGYRFLYLTSRALGQANSTRGYLRGVAQDQCQLPDGPVIMSPDRLLAALRREVVLGNPQEFKIACLRDIQLLFQPPSFKKEEEELAYNPLYAGFGNRSTDVTAYLNVGIAQQRIFVINPMGTLSIEPLSDHYRGSYTQLSDLTDLIFPPIPILQTSEGENTKNEEYNDFWFWRRPMTSSFTAVPFEQEQQLTMFSSPSSPGLGLLDQDDTAEEDEEGALVPSYYV